MTWELFAGPFPTIANKPNKTPAWVQLECTECGERVEGHVMLKRWARASVSAAMQRVEIANPCGCNASAPTINAAAVEE